MSYLSQRKVRTHLSSYTAFNTVAITGTEVLTTNNPNQVTGNLEQERSEECAMDEMFCNQESAYPSSVPPGGELDAVRVYEQLKEAIQSVERTLNDEEKLLVLWHDATGVSMVVNHIGYFGQAFLVFSGRDAKTAECTALVPAHLAQVLLKTTQKKQGETFHPINFMGHAVKPCG